MKYTEATKGKLVRLHKNSTKSKAYGEIYEIVVAPKNKLDTVCITRQYGDGTKYNVCAERLSNY